MKLLKLIDLPLSSLCLCVSVVQSLAMCSAFGATPAEALREVEKAKQLWLEMARVERKPIPPPRYRPAIYKLAS